MERRKPITSDKKYDGSCKICGSQIGLHQDGGVFVACGQCAFPVCRTCYEFIDKVGNQSCPKCHTRYGRLAAQFSGSPPLAGNGKQYTANNWRCNSKSYHVSEIPKDQTSEDRLACSMVYGRAQDDGLCHYPGKASALVDVAALANFQRNRMVIMRPSPHPLSKRTLSYPSSGYWGGKKNHIFTFSLPCIPVHRREKQTPKLTFLFNSKSLTWRERLRQWKLMQKMFSWKVRKSKESNDVDSCASSKEVEEQLEIDSEFRQSLSRKVRIPPSKINPFRVAIFLRLAIVALYLRSRLVNPVRNAYGLWLTSVICELWFSICWILDQLLKWHPIKRETYTERLCLRYNKAGKPSQLACIDVFITTVDPVKEPPILIANTVLSILSVDYPAEKVSCYVSDDGAALLTLETLLATREFAKEWVPFCKKFYIEPRLPECYFSQKVDYLKYNTFPTFAKERRAIKVRQYEEFKVFINGLVAKSQTVPCEGWAMKDGTPWPGNNTQNHPAMLQIIMGRGRLFGNDGKELPQLVYVSREKSPGIQHNWKAGAMNSLVRVSALLSNGSFILDLDCNHHIHHSKVLLEAMCFMMDPDISEKICHVQFPQRFDGVDKNDRYANHNTVLYDINLKCLDGIQGPISVGTGCFFNRKALYGYGPSRKQNFHGMSWFGSRNRIPRGSGAYYQILGRECAISPDIELCNHDREFPSTFQNLEKCFGQSTFFLATTLVNDARLSRSVPSDELLKEAIHVISCDYEDKTAWGREVGWIYGSLTSDILTGFRMHAQGWRSIYCMPAFPAFRVSAPINLTDRLNQVHHWALGSIEILLSRHCPIWYGYCCRLKFLERIAYINATIYPITSIPLVVYCTLPAVSLLTGRFIIPLGTELTSVWVPLLFLSVLAGMVVEMRWSGVGIQEQWRNQQFSVIAGVSSHLFAVFQGLLNAMRRANSTPSVMDKNFRGDFMELFVFKWSSLLLMPTTLILINLWGMVVGIVYVISSGYGSWRLLFCQLFLAWWVIAHLHPFLGGLLVRRHQIPTVIIVWSVLLTTFFSLLWSMLDPFTTRYRGPDVIECGIYC